MKTHYELLLLLMVKNRPYRPSVLYCYLYIVNCVGLYYLFKTNEINKKPIGIIQNNMISNLN